MYSSWTSYDVLVAILQVLVKRKKCLPRGVQAFCTYVCTVFKNVRTRILILLTLHSYCCCCCGCRFPGAPRSHYRHPNGYPGLWQLPLSAEFVVLSKCSCRCGWFCLCTWWLSPHRTACFLLNGITVGPGPCFRCIRGIARIYLVWVCFPMPSLGWFPHACSVTTRATAGVSTRFLHILRKYF